MKATAVAPANIAFIKYWGKKDSALRLPTNPSISMNLSSCLTTTTVEVSADFSEDTVTEGFDKKRIVAHLDRIRKIAGVTERAHVTTKNSFPTATGVASSASGFAALTIAGAAALGLQLSEKELTKLARLGSGSACRSIPDGFVKWEEEVAWSLYPPEYWDLCDILVIVGEKTKDVSSSEGHERAETSPFFNERLAAIPKRIGRIEMAFKNKDFQALGEVIEEDCLDMHHVMQTQNPPLYYWNDDTVRIMELIKQRTVPAYFTIDAGPNVHIICEAKSEDAVKKLFEKKFKIIVNKPAKGAHLV